MDQEIAPLPSPVQELRHPVVDLFHKVPYEHPEQLSRRLLVESTLRALHASHSVEFRNEPYQRLLK